MQIKNGEHRQKMSRAPSIKKPKAENKPMKGNAAVNKRAIRPDQLFLNPSKPA